MAAISARALLLCSILLLISLGFAQETPKLGFGTMQSGKSAVGSPGENITVRFYFFVDSEFGNRITHITLTPIEVPSGWEADIRPPLHKVTLNISGALSTIEENLHVNPRPKLSAIPEDREEGVVYLSSPSGGGYLQAKEANVTFRIPENAELGATYSAKIEALAQWYGEEATVTTKQARDFDYTITVRAKEFEESVLSYVPEKEAVPPRDAAEKEEGRKEPEPSFDAAKNLPLLAGGAAFLLIAIYIAFFRKPAPQKTRPPEESGPPPAPPAESGA